MDLGKAQKRWLWFRSMRADILKTDGEERGSDGVQTDQAQVLCTAGKKELA